ncbi:capsid assembly protein [Pseudomonas phage phiIBB-PF7A]|uniref:Capsid assembly protein n=1 Tax=Pseudomonas phage phiIBB-PF7A TaxID=942165 RepID=E9KIG5_9CAUD|nr:head assembly [Pseudomonas phage phiIBB-PF7A]ADV35690.1 capsid assembly protein [Pseudomonas phage phiIBB-PF7A]
MSESPYAQFGVHNAVLTSDTIEDHRQNMLEQDVDVRDGDDAITLHEDAGVTVTDLVDDELNTDDRIEINVPTDGEFNEQATDDGANDGAEVEGDGEAFEPLGDIPDELTQASNQISEYATGFEQMKAQAVERGLPADMAARVEAEYEADGVLSEESLTALEAAGFGRGFVQAYIQGQEAMAEAYVSKVMDFAGGKEAFNRVLTHMQANSPDALEALEEAIQRQDIKAVKTTINLAMASQAKKFGRAPARNVNARAPASAPRAAAPVVEGYANTDAMVAAMSDRRYQTDAKYRAAVQAKVAASNW